jgi:hypothetical protein
MKFTNLLIVMTALVLSSCSRDRRLDDYYHIVDSADKVIIYAKTVDTFSITRTIDSLGQLKNMKNTLKRHIKPETQRIFIPTNKIEIYRDGKMQGVLVISGSNEDPFVNFVSDKFGFGFKLTYGIGMSL